MEGRKIEGGKKTKEMSFTNKYPKDGREDRGRGRGGEEIRFFFFTY